ncbi:MAG: efflux RND transporter permease subunit, partial [Anaerolineae bacterium]|nr:efflux RND transporter permease subunit [Anaerolineae bacterium]
MKAFFNLLTSLSLRFRFVTLLLVATVTVLGVVGATQLKQELIPPIELPFTIILGQASGMTADQVMQIVTMPLENELDKIEELVNIESTTTASFGVVINASNEFGINKDRLTDEVQAAIDQMWLPVRRIQAPEGQDPELFARELLSDLTPNVLIYLAERDPNFLFQLSPTVWASLSDDTVRTTLAYLAAQTETSQGAESALSQLVDREMVPRLESLDQVAQVRVSGGQALPDELDSGLAAADTDVEATSSLLRLSDDTWELVSRKAGLGETLDQSAVDALSEVSFSVPDSPPPLPDSWRVDHFKDASDLLEMETLTRTAAAVFNSFVSSGHIVGGLGQTDDLTPEVVSRMLEIDPSMVEYFEADQLAAMPPDVFAVLPEDFLANLDGFTRDALAASALAETITGDVAIPEPVDLPAAWSIQPPQIFPFSFDDVPLVIYSVFGDFDATPTPVDTEETAQADTNTDTATETTAEESTAAEEPVTDDIPEGPALPFLFNLLGGQFGTELNTADDLIDIQLPEEMAAQLGSDRISAADFLGFLVLLSDPESLPPGTPEIPIDLSSLITSLSPDVIEFLIENDPTFLPNLQSTVYERFSDDVLALPQISPLLDSVWDTLSNQPQFTERPLETAGDVLAIGEGNASAVLNTINDTVPEQFAGYEVRLFNSLSPAVMRYFAINEPDFYENLDVDVLRKLSPETLAQLPEDFLDSLDDETATQLRAIASGEQESAAAELASRYTSDVPPSDPDAPALNDQWSILEPFYNVELDSADDFFRFPDGFIFEDAASMMNSIFDSAQGATFAPNLFGNMSVEAVQYMLDRDPAVFDTLVPEAVREFSDEVFAILPPNVQEIAEAGGEPFVPTSFITRSNGHASLLLTINKTTEANNVETFHIVDDIMREIDAENDDIQVAIALETASFVEDSIEGVAREGSLGAIFAIIIILIFLSDGIWGRSARRRTGSFMVVLFALALVVLVASGLEAAGGDVGLAFAQADTVLRVLLLLGILMGLAARFWPGNIPDPAWRSTLVVTVSIPLSILTALALMNWLPPLVNGFLTSLGDSAFISFILRLFPENLTLNIMTLSGLTVAIGRVVDDSIVVLENIFREIQLGTDKREAILAGTRDVSVAIFSATMIVIVVFLPLGLTGGLISEFFLPFGLTVSYALIASFFVAVTVVPALAYMLVRDEDIAGEDAGPIAGKVATVYVPVLRWALSTRSSRWLVLIIAFLSVGLSGFLFGQRPFAFLPDFGDPEIQISVEMPSGTKALETNELVRQMEDYIQENIPEDEIETLRVSIGGGAFNQASLLGGSSVSENVAIINVKLESREAMERHLEDLRAEAERIFGAEHVTAELYSLIDAGGFSSFELVMSGPQDE